MGANSSLLFILLWTHFISDATWDTFFGLADQGRILRLMSEGWDKSSGRWDTLRYSTVASCIYHSRRAYHSVFQYKWRALLTQEIFHEDIILVVQCRWQLAVGTRVPLEGP
eukprot:scaffold667_cov304-Chaetoceros_neogracile.AAC.4